MKKILIACLCLLFVVGCVAIKCKTTITDPNSGNITSIDLDYQRNFADMNASDVNIVFDLKEEKATVQFKSNQSPQNPAVQLITTIGLVLIALWKVCF